MIMNTDLPHSDGPVIIQRTGRFGYKNLSIIIYKKLIYSQLYEYLY